MMENKKHILIVDDNLKNLQLTGKILKDEGYLISLAAESQMAWSLLSSTIPDLILLDIMMPGMDGLGLCRKIKDDSRFNEIPIIFLTAKTRTEDLVEGFEAGGVDYITKPFRREVLLIRVKNHIELSTSRKKILEMSKNRDKLYSIIAHDIRSPLSGILFMLSAIKGDVIPLGSAEYQEIVEGLEKQTEDTASLLDNLLSWTKAQSENIRLIPKENCFHSIILECISLLQTNANRKKIRLHVGIPVNSKAFFDEVTMHIVFRNILSNAIKFTPEGGTISITSQTRENLFELSFKDNGTGIPAHILDKIVVQNQHHTSPGTSNEQGTGLGLVLVRDFVQKNHGNLKINSKQGEGTEILISLPLKEVL